MNSHTAPLPVSVALDFAESVFAVRAQASASQRSSWSSRTPAKPAPRSRSAHASGNAWCRRAPVRQRTGCSSRAVCASGGNGAGARNDETAFYKVRLFVPKYLMNMLLK